MGCDIHSFAETRNDDGTWQATGDVFPSIYAHFGEPTTEEPFQNGSYALFAWLAGVRNYGEVTPLAEPRGLPDVSRRVAEEVEIWEGDGHSYSWFTVAELLAVDYDSTQVNDRRIERNGDGGVTGTPGEGTVMTLRQYLGPGYFERLDLLARLGKPDAVRVVFWFDN